ncbi:MAG: four helix bundle protein [Candidatus Kerfeldbacteria bacterium]|nr:four helix bundle protein [Candidatus Kerfeldbacteria bacterium]
MVSPEGKLKNKTDDYVHKVYAASKHFPKDELYGVTSQLRRAALSVILNYVEGYARQRPAVCANFWLTAYGSLQESKYLLDFSHKERYCNEQEHTKLTSLANEIGAMLWRSLQTIKQRI